MKYRGVWIKCQFWDKVVGSQSTMLFLEASRLKVYYTQLFVLLKNGSDKKSVQFQSSK
jgi:hypothetical protein